MGRSSDKLLGKQIIVVGGSTGIGYGAAEAFVAAGAHVTVVSSQQAHVDEAVGQLRQVQVEAGIEGSEGRATVAGVVANVRDEAAFTAALQSLAPVDHIVFSAVDLIIRGPLVTADLDAARDLFGVKFWGSVVVAKAVLAAHHGGSTPLVRPGGSLTLTSGAAAFRSASGAAIGAALNAAVINLTQNLAQEFRVAAQERKERSVRVNTVVPGLVKTPLWDKLGRSAAEQEQLFASGSETLSVGFVAVPADIAEAYLYLVRADYANGSVVLIDGGRSYVS